MTITLKNIRRDWTAAAKRSKDNMFVVYHENSLEIKAFVHASGTFAAYQPNFKRQMQNCIGKPGRTIQTRKLVLELIRVEVL